MVPQSELDYPALSTVYTAWFSTATSAMESPEQWLLVELSFGWFGHGIEEFWYLKMCSTISP